MNPGEIYIGGKLRPVVRLNFPSVDSKRVYERYPYDIKVLDAANNPIGSLTLRVNIPDSWNGTVRNVARVSEINIDAPYVGKGFGKATYLEILKFLGDMPLQSGSINDNSIGIWESLVRDGLAEREYTQDEGGEKQVRYISRPDIVKVKLIGQEQTE